MERSEEWFNIRKGRLPPPELQTLGVKDWD